MLMRQFLRNGLVALVAAGCAGAPACSPASRPPVARIGESLPAPAPPRDAPPTVSSSGPTSAATALSPEPRAVTDEEKPAPDERTDKLKAASPDERGALEQVPEQREAPAADGVAELTDEEIERIGLADDPEAETFTIPDCRGGKIVAPLWIRNVPFWAALCVHGLPKKPLRVDVSTSLVAHAELNNGDAVNRFQVYYALEQVRVAPNEKGLIWAMCGGGGNDLTNGSRVVPAHRLPAEKSTKIAEHVTTLKAIGRDLIMARYTLRTTKDPIKQRYLKRQIKDLDGALKDAAGLLRDAIIKENRSLLSRISGQGAPPTSSSPAPGPPSPPPGVRSSIPPPILH